MNAQSDLFYQPVEVETETIPALESAAPLGEPIAVPCGFVDRTNNRCRRLGHRPVLIDGVQLVSAGRPMLHCDPACFSAFGMERRTGADTDWP